MHANVIRLAAIAVALVLAFGTSEAEAQVYHLPWTAGQSVYVTQDCNDSCCGDHVGYNQYAWDFAVNGAFEVVAPRAGTVVHVKMSSDRGGDSREVDTANYIVIDHGDGNASVMLHLARGSLSPNIRCGDFVRAGQRLAMSGATGWASGNHLHYQVNRIPANMPMTCECGADGMGCRADEAHWELFWSRDPGSTSVPIQFAEWRGASVCGDRHDDNVLVSRNVDTRESYAVLASNEPGRFVPIAGEWSATADGSRRTFHQAAAGRDASAMMSFAGRVPGSGVYEVWSGLPARGRNVGATTVRTEVIARGERGVGSFAQNTPGGAYRPVSGRFKLTGRAGEGLVLSASGRTAEALAVDNVVLRRVADAGNMVEGGVCHSSAECSGDLVCSDGRCHAGCEIAGCRNGATCDPTGLCVGQRGATQVAQVDHSEHRVAPVTAERGDAGGASQSPHAQAQVPQSGGGPSASQVPSVTAASAAEVPMGPLSRRATTVLLGIGAALAAIGAIARKRAE